ERLAKNAVDFRNPQFDWRLIQSAAYRVDLIPLKACAAGFDDSLCHSCTSQRGCTIISTAFETMRCVSVQSMPLGCLADNRGIKPRRFNQDVLRLLRNHGVEAAHDARKRYRFPGISDDQIFGRKFAINTIQRLQRLSSPRPAHDDLAAF